MKAETVMQDYGTTYRLGTMVIKDVMVTGWRGAIKGMRYPMNSETLSDSVFNGIELIGLGERDKELILKLSKAGASHRKVLRMLHIQMSVKMTLSFWTQYDTYKVATVANSRSRMHRFGKLMVEKADFYEQCPTNFLSLVIENVNKFLAAYKITEGKEKKRQWRMALDSLPITYLQERMLDLSYETALQIILTRTGEKLESDWGLFIHVLREACPLLNDLYLQFASIKEPITMGKQMELPL